LASFGGRIHQVLQALKHWQATRAFKRIPRAQRKIVIYAESGQDWHHFRPVVDCLCDELHESVIYVTSDFDDPALKRSNSRLRAFNIGNGAIRTAFFQWLDADLVLMTMVDLNNLQIKRSVNPVYYVFMFHSLISTHMADHADTYDHYDAILCAGPHQLRETRKREELHDLPVKELVPHGYHRLEELMANRREPPAHNQVGVHVLLAPSWGDETILNLCGLELVTVLLDAGFRVTLRPHFQTRWKTPEFIDRIAEKYAGHERFSLMEQMGENDSLFDSHVMITDWSGAGMDYGMGLEKPVLYIDVPAKARNDVWPELEMEPFESYVRTRIGALLSMDRLDQAPEKIRELIADPERFQQEVGLLRDEWVFNLGTSSLAAAEAVVRMANESAAKQSGSERSAE
jgi:hypothetical protein